MTVGRIVVFGDSFTFGQGLDNTEIAHDAPHALSWPYVLGNLLNIPVLNLSLPGASNKAIWWTALNFPFTPTDLCIFCWSCPQRHMVINVYDDSPSENFLRSQVTVENDIQKISQYGSWMEDDVAAMSYYGYLYTDLDAIIGTLAYIQHIDMHLKKTIDLCYHTAIPCIDEFEILHHGENYFEHTDSNPEFRRPEWFDLDIVATMTQEKFEIGQTLDGHLSIEANDHFAKRVYDIIKKDLT